MRRKTKQDQESRQGSWRNQPAMAGEDAQTNQEKRSRQNDINDWQAQRLLSRSMLQQIVQELIDEEASRPEKTIASGDEQLRVQLHNATIADEAWHVKLIASEDERIAELQRYVARVVQYLSYCICGQRADQLLSRIKDSKFAVLLRRYNECIKVMKWAEHEPLRRN